MKKIFVLITTILVGLVGTIFLGGFVVYSNIPSEKEIKGCILTTMFNLDLCPSSKNYVKLSAISSKLQRTIILTEDSAFYTHNGFDQEGIQRCFEKLKETHKISCGGSTITQQLAKNMFLSQDKTFIRKGLEALITIKIEKVLTKKEILEKYLNIVQFGKNIYGVKQASQYYFKKQPSELDAVESAFLAMVLPNPEKYSQSYYRKDLTRFARKRITDIINDMYRYKSISEDDYNSSLAKLENFLQAGHALQNNNPAELSHDDLTEMLEESEDTTSLQQGSRLSPSEEDYNSIDTATEQTENHDTNKTDKKEDEKSLKDPLDTEN